MTLHSTDGACESNPTAIRSRSAYAWRVQSTCIIFRACTSPSMQPHPGELHVVVREKLDAPEHVSAPIAVCKRAFQR